MKKFEAFTEDFGIAVDSDQIRNKYEAVKEERIKLQKQDLEEKVWLKSEVEEIIRTSSDQIKQLLNGGRGVMKKVQ